MPKFDAEGNEVDQGLGAFSAVYEHGCGHMDSSTCLEDLHRRACATAWTSGSRPRSPSSRSTAAGARARSSRTAPASRRRLRSTRRALVRTAEDLIEDAAAARRRRSLGRVRSRRFNALNETVGVKNSTTSLPTRIQVGHKYIPDSTARAVRRGRWGDSGIPARAGNNQLVRFCRAPVESEIVDPPTTTTRSTRTEAGLPQLLLPPPARPRDVRRDRRLLEHDGQPGRRAPVIGESTSGPLGLQRFRPGFKLAPAVGSLVAQQITDSRRTREDVRGARLQGPGHGP